MASAMSAWTNCAIQQAFDELYDKSPAAKIFVEKAMRRDLISPRAQPLHLAANRAFKDPNILRLQATQNQAMPPSFRNHPYSKKNDTAKHLPESSPSSNTHSQENLNLWKRKETGEHNASSSQETGETSFKNKLTKGGKRLKKIEGNEVDQSAREKEGKEENEEHRNARLCHQRLAAKIGNVSIKHQTDKEEEKEQWTEDGSKIENIIQGLWKKDKNFSQKKIAEEDKEVDDDGGDGIIKNIAHNLRRRSGKRNSRRKVDDSEIDDDRGDDCEKNTFQSLKNREKRYNRKQVEENTEIKNDTGDGRGKTTLSLRSKEKEFSQKTAGEVESEVGEGRGKEAIQSSRLREKGSRQKKVEEDTEEINNNTGDDSGKNVIENLRSRGKRSSRKQVVEDDTEVDDGTGDDTGKNVIASLRKKGKQYSKNKIGEDNEIEDNSDHHSEKNVHGLRKGRNQVRSKKIETEEPESVLHIKRKKFKDKETHVPPITSQEEDEEGRGEARAGVKVEETRKERKVVRGTRRQAPSGDEEDGRVERVEERELPPPTEDSVLDGELDVRLMMKTTSRPLSSTPRLPLESSLRSKVVEMRKWAVKIMDGPCIIVEGFPLESGCVPWLSEPIVKRVNNTEVRTECGTCYQLKGKMSSRRAQDAGLSEKLAKAFRYGFPTTWRQLIQETTSKTSSDADSMCDTFTKKVKKGRPGKSGKPKTENLKGSKKDPLSLADLPTTRSGRRVKPPLAYWAGQRVVYRPGSDSVEIVPPTPTPVMMTSPFDLSICDTTVHFLSESKSETMSGDEKTGIRRKVKGKNLRMMSDTSQEETSSDERRHKRRGRKPNPKTASREESSSEETQRRKRGGKPNPKTASQEESSSEETRGRKRGRKPNPKTASQEESSSEETRGRKRGRKPNPKTASQEESSSEETRGRKRGRKPNPKTASQEESSSEETRGRKRGRKPNPKTATSEKKPARGTKQRESQRGTRNSKIVELSYKGTGEEVSDKETGQKVSDKGTGQKVSDKGTGQKVSDKEAGQEVKQQEKLDVEETRELEEDPLCLSYGMTPLQNLRKFPTEPYVPLLPPPPDNCETDVLSQTPTLNALTPALSRLQQRLHGLRKKLDVQDEVQEEEEVSGRQREQLAKTETAQSKPRHGKILQGRPQKNRSKKAKQPQEEPLEEVEEVDKESEDETYVPTKKPAKKRRIVKAQRKVKPQERAGEKNSEISTSQTDQNESAQDPDSSPDSHLWTDTDVKQYKLALQTINPAVDQYWEKMAAFVATKTAPQCQAYHQRDAPETLQKKKTKLKLNKTEGERAALTGGVGTLKRKRELKELIRQHDENHNDDLFDSTPLRKTKKIKLPSMDEDDDMEFFRNRPNTETPVSARSTPKPRFAWLPPREKTPVSHIPAPTQLNTVDRKNDEAYVHKLIQARNRRTRGSKRLTIKDPQTPVTARSSSVELYKELFNGEKSDSDNHHDSDQESDYYFSDDGN